jgi:hypothetical protein
MQRDRRLRGFDRQVGGAPGLGAAGQTLDFRETARRQEAGGT